MLEAFLVSTLVVAVGELGDKTQLLTLVLAARYRKPWPIIAGILVATLANHTVAAWLGHWVRDAVSPEVLRWGLALSFFAVAAWALKPDQFDADDAPPSSNRNVFIVTVVAFFLAERPRCSPQNSIRWSRWSRARRSGCCWSTRPRRSSATRRPGAFHFAPCVSWPRRSLRGSAFGCWWPRGLADRSPSGPGRPV
jgi:hypothetical protein